MKNYIILFFAVVALGLSGSGYALQDSEFLLQEIGAIDTDLAIDMVAVGSCLYTIHPSDGLKLYDVSDPSAFHAIGKARAPRYVHGLGVSGNYAYVTSNTVAMGFVDRFSVFDISDPSSPNLVGSVNLPPSYSVSAHDIIALGDYAYVSNGYSGLQIIDVSNPEAPFVAASLDTGGSVHGLALSGSHAFVAADGRGLLVVDISHPTSPLLIGQVGMVGTLYDVVVQGEHAYVARGSNGLQIINIANPAAPSLTKLVDTPGYANGVSTHDQYALIADCAAGLQVVDISDPVNSFICGALDTGYIDRIEVSGSLSYVTATTWDGIRVIDISDAVNPALINIPGRMRFCRGVAISGTHAYVSEGGFGDLQVVDISNPFLPEIIGSANTGGNARRAAISGQYAYVADNAEGLLILDISNPLAPTIIGSVDTGDITNDVAVSGEYAYALNAYTGLFVIDVSNPSAPSIVKNVLTPGHYAYALAISGNYAFVADADVVEIIDISNPPNASIVASLDTYNSVDIAISGAYAYVADSENGLQIVDITNPTSPIIVGSVAPVVDGYLQATITAIAATEHYAFAGNYVLGDWDYFSKVLAIDVTDPFSPQIVHSVDLPGVASDLIADSEYVYAADTDAGFKIFSYSTDPGLREIHLIAPANGSIINSPPTLEWKSIGGDNNAYAVDFSLPPFFPFWSTFNNLHQIIYETTWTPPLQAWERIPLGSRVYWRVRGVDLNQQPRVITTSDEVWSFEKQ